MEAQSRRFGWVGLQQAGTVEEKTAWTSARLAVFALAVSLTPLDPVVRKKGMPSACVFKQQVVLWQQRG
jgi:hypothetical protein